MSEINMRYRLAWQSARRRARIAAKAFHAEASAAKELELEELKQKYLEAQATGKVTLVASEAFVVPLEDPNDPSADEWARLAAANADADAMAAPVANRARVAEVLQRAIHLLDSNPKQWNELDPIEQVAYRDEAESLAIALFTSSGVFRDEATVKAEALEEAATDRHGITKTRGDAVDKYLRNRAARLRDGIS